MSIRSDIPQFYQYFFQIMLCSFLNDLLFYFIHRLLHHESIYLLIHKKHHEYNSTISYAAEYSNLIEQLLANFLPTFLGF
jgi:sterol desaturase/sphingolipid hydroxylase (fatty acid hydroxylase superfamily)